MWLRGRDKEMRNWVFGTDLESELIRSVGVFYRAISAHTCVSAVALYTNIPPTANVLIVKGVVPFVKEDPHGYCKDWEEKQRPSGLGKKKKILF